jgi:hypothetical protein
MLAPQHLNRKDHEVRRLQAIYFAMVGLAVLTCVPGTAALAQGGAVTGPAERWPGRAGGEIVCDGRRGCAPLRPGCRVLRGGGSFDTVVSCGPDAGRKSPKQKSMRGSEN